MRLVSFNLTEQPLSGYDAAAEVALRALPGVNDVLIGDVNDTCSVVYDERHVDTRQLAAALLGAGYASRLVLQPPSGSCCGACS